VSTALVHAASSLAPWDPDAHGGWNSRHATHLLWRAQFGVTDDEIARATGEGLASTLERLLSPQPETDDFQFTADLLRQSAYDSANVADLKAWWIYRMRYSANPLVEKMSLLWHNHFATSYAKVQSVEQMTDQNDLIRTHALGRFDTMLHGMIRDVAMLVWLDGNANRKRHANENLARELMELFSLGVGNYTEVDITEAARALTGWHVREDAFWIDALNHDDGRKTVLGSTGRFDGDDLVDICLAQPACPRFLATKLLRTFVVPNPSAELVDALAARIREHNFDMRPVLGELLTSEAFFADESRHAIIKSPIDLVLGAQRALESQTNLQSTVQLLAELGQDVFEPPTVKGWEGDRLWIDSATLLRRIEFATQLTRGERYATIDRALARAAEQEAQHPSQVVDHYVELLLARDLEPAIEAGLERHLRESSGPFEERLRGTIQMIMAMPEFQLV